MLLILALLIPNPANLGVDDFQEREAWTAAYSNVFSALLLPNKHEDAEINHRCKSIKAHTLRELDPRYIESMVKKDQYAKWIKEYVYPRRSSFTDYENFVDIHDGGATVFFSVLKPLNNDETFMQGGICPGEFDRYLTHLHRYRSPATVDAPAAILKGVAGWIVVPQTP